MLIVLSFFVLISGVLAIYLMQTQRIKWFTIFKPLTTLLIIVLAVIIFLERPGSYSTIIITSLVFAFAGDVFLMYKKFFLQGLSFFLIAQIGFTIGFTSLFGFNITPLPLLFLVPFGIGYYLYLRKDLHSYVIPIAVYIPVILLMCWQATSLVFEDNSMVYVGIALGSLLFTFSDSVIAYTTFKKTFWWGEVLILSTYWAAIYIFTIAGKYV